MNHDELIARLDELQELLAHIASVAHTGGLRDLRPETVLVLVRKLSLQHWDASGTSKDMARRVGAAIDAARGGGK